MKLFRRKRNDEEELDEETPRRNRTSRKAMRGNPTSSRLRGTKKKEKPWGKRERILILVIFIFTAGASGFLAMSSRAWKLPGLPLLKVPSMPKISFLSEETIVIEGNQKNIEKKEIIASKFQEMTKDLTGVYGLYVINLNDGFSFGVNETDEFEPASLNKLPVMFALYREAKMGNLDLDTEYTLKDSDKISGSGNLDTKPAGTVLTYRELASLMGKQSDNTAFGIIRKIIGDEKINAVIGEVGMSNTSIEKNKTTPVDIGTFFEKLYSGSLIDEDAKNEILDSLTNTIYEDWLPVGIPDDVRIVHKFGRETNVINDAGIIFSDDPFILVILSKGIVDDEVDGVLVKTSENVYSTLSSQ